MVEDKALLEVRILVCFSNRFAAGDSRLTILQHGYFVERNKFLFAA